MSSNNKGQFVQKLRSVFQWAYRLRSLVLTIPVAIAAVILAIRNSQLLPAVVRFDIAAVKEAQLVFQTVAVGRGTAVIVPLLVTFACIAMVFCSKKQIYPFLVSLFSLSLPLVLLLINTFP